MLCRVVTVHFDHSMSLEESISDFLWLRGVNPSSLFSVIPGRKQLSPRQVGTQIKRVVYLVGQKPWLECSPQGLGLDTPYLKSTYIPCDTPNILHTSHPGSERQITVEQKRRIV